eukprot:m.20013 g.20013  ORF g.20013 m.20013 type:complete len:421 (+) comp10987_c0_seq2:65-1327(+)
MTAYRKSVVTPPLILGEMRSNHAFRLWLVVVLGFLAALLLVHAQSLPRQPSLTAFSAERRSFHEHVLVTGGAGYIGSHAALALLRQGYKVTVVDNLSRGNYGAIDVLMKLAADHQFAFVRLDLGHRAKVVKLLQQLQVDAIIHFAAVAYVGESVADPLRYYQNVTANTYTLLQAAKQANVAKFIYSSSCATYGNPSAMPITEETPQQPVSPYGQSKLDAEHAVRSTQASTPAMSSAILRYFNVIGSDPLGRLGEAPDPVLSQKYGRISGACFDAARRQRDSLGIFGTSHPTPDGTCVRDYIHVSDLVDAHIQVLGKLQPSDLRIYNVGTGTGVSVRKFISSCQQVTNVSFPVEEHPGRVGDAAEVYADCSKIHREIGWQAQHTDVSSTLATAWLWQRANPSGYPKIQPPADVVISGLNSE